MAVFIADQLVLDLRCGRGWRFWIEVDGLETEEMRVDSLKLRHKLERARLDLALVVVVVVMDVELVKLRSRSESW